MNVVEQHRQEAPERRAALSFIGWVQVTGTLIAIILMGAVLRLIGPYLGWWAPLITDAVAIVFITCIFGAPIALVLHLWQKSNRENFRSRLVRPTPENAYPAYWDGQTFHQPTALPPPNESTDSSELCTDDPATQRYRIDTDAARNCVQPNCLYAARTAARTGYACASILRGI